MNELVIPNAPHWYRSSMLACAPDNTLVYGAKNDIVVIRDQGPNEPSEVKVISGAHTKSVLSVSLNRKWKNPHCHIVSLCEDGVLKLWDLDTFELKETNKDHLVHHSPVIGAVFAGDDRIVSAAAKGYVIVWNINTNESKPLSDLFNYKVTLTCLSSCPHVGWLLGFGLNNGGVVIADMRRNGRVLYKLRGHYQPVVSLSWCPAPVNIFPKNTRNLVKNKSLDPQSESGDKSNPWVNLVHADDDDNANASEDNHKLRHSVDNFLQECAALKNKILGVTQQQAEESNADSQIINEYDEKGIQEASQVEVPKRKQENRPLPICFDPSCDFLDDLSSDQEEINEDKDVGDEKHTQDENIRKEEECGDVGEKNDDGAITPIEEEPRSEYLLASSGKDQMVYIWRAGTDGRMQTFFNASKKSKREKKNVWMTVHWLAPDTILTSTITGELLAWTLPKPKESNKLSKMIHYEHSSTIFNIVSPPRYYTQYNWRDSMDLSVWTWGIDGLLIDFDITGQKVRSCYSPTTAAVIAFECSLLDPNRLVVALRDGCISVWDLSVPHTKIITMEKYNKKITNKISALAWHPLKEMVLGFGTEEGRVGYIDLISKKSTLLHNFFRSTVFKVEWGPLDGDTDNLGLYAVAEGNICIYDTKETNDEPTLLEFEGKTYIYKFAWKPDFSLLLVNGKDGSLIIFKPDLTPISTIYLTDKGLNSIVWHPDGFIDKIDVSPRCYWFACTTTKGLMVYDCSLYREKPDSTVNFMDNIIAVFEGHLKATTSLAWCPHDGNKIVSTASDGLAHVWDISSKTLISTFIDHYLSFNPAIVWSPLDPDLIIMGDRMIKIWSISKNPPKLDNDSFMTQRISQLNKKKIEVEKGESAKVNVQIKKPPKYCVVPQFFVSNDSNFTEQVADMRRILEGEKIDNPLQIFGTQEQVTQLLSKHYESQKKEGKQRSCELIALWQGNVSDLVKNAISTNSVTPTILNLAPMVSTKLWQEACEIYAKKLSEISESDPMEVVSYFLACHKIVEAIDHLCLNLMFREALALAKQRFPDSSDIVKNITLKWASNCITNGNFENAAYCYISIKQYGKAAQVLARRNNKEFLEFAAELAEKEGNQELLNSIKYKYNDFNGESSGKAYIENGAIFQTRIDVLLNQNEVTQENGVQYEINSDIEAAQKSDEESSKEGQVTNDSESIKSKNIEPSLQDESDSKNDQAE